MFNEIDLARLAALIDGEGCIAITKPCSRDDSGRKYHLLVIDVANSDIRLMVWLKNTFGGCIDRSRNQYRKGTLTKKICFVWRTHSKAAEDLLRFCMPYFLLKGKQAEIALEFRDTVTRKNGRRGMSKDLFAIREGYRLTLSKMKKEVGQLLTVKE